MTKPDRIVQKSNFMGYASERELKRAGYAADFLHSGVHHAHAGGDAGSLLRAVLATYEDVRRHVPFPR